MSEFKVFTFVTTFITLYFLFMIPMGGVEIFTEQNFNVSEEDLTITPDIPERQTVDINLTDDIQFSNNIENVSIEEIEDPEFTRAEYVLKLEDSSQAGEVYYNVPENVNSVNTFTTSGGLIFPLTAETQLGHFESSNIENFFEDALRISGLRGDFEVTLEDQANVIGIHINAESDWRIYDLNYKTTGVTGIFDTVVAWFNSAVNYIQALIGITLQMPVYLSIPFGLYFGYLIVKILSLL